jgi:hypothetical protein
VSGLEVGLMVVGVGAKVEVGVGVEVGIGVGVEVGVGVGVRVGVGVGPAIIAKLSIITTSGNAHRDPFSLSNTFIDTRTRPTPPQSPTGCVILIVVGFVSVIVCVDRHSPPSHELIHTNTLRYSPQKEPPSPIVPYEHSSKYPKSKVAVLPVFVVYSSLSI